MRLLGIDERGEKMRTHFRNYSRKMTSVSTKQTPSETKRENKKWAGQKRDFESRDWDPGLVKR